ncbi:MAG: hypothetical protein ABEH43_00145, partial [Flavobacteriales bacterium]
MSILGILLALPSLSQEKLTPLKFNSSLLKKQPEKETYIHKRSVVKDENHIFKMDTLSLPFKDDFSVNTLTERDVDTSDEGVKDTVIYHLYESGVPVSDTAALNYDTSYVVEIDTNASGDTIIADSSAISSQMIRVNEIGIYPEINDSTKSMWPAITVYDTLWNGNKDTVIHNIKDEVQDSVRWIIVSDQTEALWQDEQAFINSQYPVDPPTVGVATLDGIDENGYPYDFSDQFAHGLADALTSKPIKLDLVPSDSIYLSFFYQPEGIGNDPQPEDSLLVEFYAPKQDEWNHIWSVKGDSLRGFNEVMIPIEDTAYLHSGFKFRFRNYSTLSGNFDHWHIDYVKLDKSRSCCSSEFDDVAFREEKKTLLKSYT